MRNVFSLSLKTATESLLRTVCGSEFQTAGARPSKMKTEDHRAFPKIEDDSMAVSSKCEQCRVHSRRRRLNTDLSLIASASKVMKSVASVRPFVSICFNHLTRIFACSLVTTVARR